MKISVFGLGYVGTVSAACLSADGHQVIGVDSSITKVDLINAGTAPIVEKDIAPLLGEAVATGRLRATTDVRDAVANSELSLVCVGTPSQRNGNLDLSHVEKVCEEIGACLARLGRFHVIAIRSTMLPGSIRSTVVPALERASGLRAGVDFGVCINPEFLREGSAVWDYRNPPKTVIGALDQFSADLIERLYSNLAAPLLKTSLETAEMVKYTDNAWHALKVAFANEIGSICKTLDVDSHEVMDIFCKDTKLNLSPYYLKPGYAFGGSCLPKDLRALNYKAKAMDVEVPVLNAILPSNAIHTERGIEMVLESEKRRVGILGFSFKAGTDDLRESPLVHLIETLIGKGLELKLYDRNVNLAALVGANRDFILNHIPHISRLMVDSMEEVIAFAEVIVIGNPAEEFRKVRSIARPEQTIIDLVRITNDRVNDGGYQGICW
jgi:GDP-mannose 6-dehydrogenase